MVECYIDDIAVKSRNKNDHLHDLRTMIDIMRAHQLKMILTKSFLGVLSGKFLGFIVTSKGIHLDPDKVKAIQSMHPPKNLKELREACKETGLYQKIHRKSLRLLSTVHPTHEKGCFFCMRSSLSRSL